MNFKSIFPDSFNELKPYFKQHNYQLSTYSLSELVVWNQCAFNNYYCIENGVLILSESHITADDQSWLLMPMKIEGEVSPEEMHGILKNSSFSQYRFIPESYVNQNLNVLEKYFEVVHDSIYDDFIYLREDLAFLKGSKFSKKRNLIAQFNKLYGAQTEIKCIDNSAVIADCHIFLNQWFESLDKKYHTDELTCEHKALIQTLDNFNTVAVKGLTLYINGKMCALAIGSTLNQDTCVLNFEKALSDYKGIYQFLDQKACELLFENFTYVNKESALGDEGLYQAKHSYHPIKIEKAFILKLK